MISAQHDSTPITAHEKRSLGCRARTLQNLDIAFIGSPEFEKPNADREILGVELRNFEPTSNREARSNEVTQPLKALPAHLARLCEAELLTAEEEQTLFRKLNFLKFCAKKLQTALDLDRPKRKTVELLEALSDEAHNTRDRLIQANLRLVMSIVRKFVTPQLAFDELLSDGIFLLMNCVDKFDYRRGFRFSTYAYRSIVRNAYRHVTDTQKEMAKFVSGEIANELEQDDSQSSLDEVTWSAQRGLLLQLLDRLDRRERFIVRGRYALGCHRKVKTCQSLADKLSISKERVRQLERRAVGKLQSMAADVDMDELIGTSQRA